MSLVDVSEALRLLVMEDAEGALRRAAALLDDTGFPRTILRQVLVESPTLGCIIVDVR